MFKKFWWFVNDVHEVVYSEGVLRGDSRWYFAVDGTLVEGNEVYPTRVAAHAKAVEMVEKLVHYWQSKLECVNKRNNVLNLIEDLKNERGGKFYAENHLPHAPKFNGKDLDDVDYNSLTDKQLTVFYAAITTGVERAGNFE